MARRREILANHEIYHVYNRTIDNRESFHSKLINHRVIQAWWYLHYSRNGISFGKYLLFKPKLKSETDQELIKSSEMVQILAYCLMPNHYHLVLRQLQEGGISKYIGDTQNSIARFINLQLDRHGSLFESQFKTKRIVSNEQLVHVIRYVHLNPYTGYVIKEINELPSYPYLSLGYYLGKSVTVPLISTIATDELDLIKPDYWEFVTNQADYQRELKHIEHLIIE